MKTTVFKAGYTLRAKSSENDYDYVNTKILWIGDSLEFVEKLAEALQIINKYSNEYDGISLLDDEENDLVDDMTNFLENNPTFLSGSTEDKFVEIERYYHNLVGYSEYYNYRVIEELELIYSPEDVVLEVKIL